MTTTSAAVARPLARARARRLLPALGVGVIWLFLLLFLVYPLGRILYDAFSDDAGRLAIGNFVEFTHDAFYLRSLATSFLLGLGPVAATSAAGFAVALLLARRDFGGRHLVSSLRLVPGR